MKHHTTMKGRLGWQGLTADEYQDIGPHVVSSAHFSNFVIRWNECPRVSRERYEQDANIQLRENDILLMKDGAALGKLAQVQGLPGPACVNSHLLLLRFKELQDSQRFLFYVLCAEWFQNYMQVHGKGSTFFGVSQEAIGNFKFKIPDPRRQRAIADFLDRKTAAIDALIEKKQKLLALLAEKRTALINRAVTKGLDPDVPMKDSGVPWIGEIPAHWEVKRLKNVMSVSSRLVDPTRQPFACMPLFGPEHVTGGEGEACHPTSAVEQGAISSKYRVRKDQIVYSKIRPALQKVFIAPYQSLCSADMYPLELVSRVASRYLLLVLLSHRTTALAVLSSERVAMPKVNRETLGELSFALPAKAEQIRISNYVSERTEQLSAIRFNTETQIDKLKEYRQALITAAVTGQIDVEAV